MRTNTVTVIVLPRISIKSASLACYDVNGNRRTKFNPGENFILRISVSFSDKVPDSPSYYLRYLVYENDTLVYSDSVQLEPGVSSKKIDVNMAIPTTASIGDKYAYYADVDLVVH